MLIDLHFHILWGVDDGPQTRADTISLARAAVEAGTTTVAATSHVGWEWPDNNAETLNRRREEVRKALDDEGIPLEVVPGAEVALTRAIDLDNAELQSLYLGDGPWLLLEPPTIPEATGVIPMFEMVRARGHQIMIAHPERCPAFHRDRSTLESLVEEGMICSITARSLTGRFGKPVKRFAEGMLRDGLVHNVASDAHGVNRRTPNLLGEMRMASLSEEQRERLGEASSRAILAGAPLPGPSERRPTWRDRLRRS
jgi:protein-tyrosine phosphatase